MNFSILNLLFFCFLRKTMPLFPIKNTGFQIKSCIFPLFRRSFLLPGHVPFSSFFPQICSSSPPQAPHLRLRDHSAPRVRGTFFSRFCWIKGSVRSPLLQNHASYEEDFSASWLSCIWCPKPAKCQTFQKYVVLAFFVRTANQIRAAITSTMATKTGMAMEAT